MSFLVKGKPFVKRLSMPLDFRIDITQYGKSNLYPQLVEQVLARSATTTAAVEALRKFIAGEGFSMNGDVIVNEKEQSLDDILKLVSDDLSIYNGFALHFNVDELLMITEINYVSFPLVRYGLPNEKGIHDDVKVNKNWERDQFKMIDKTEKIKTFPLWQRRNEIEIEEEIEDFMGYIFYFTPQPDQYPKCTFDPVMDSAQTDAEIQMFELGNIQNGFLGASIMRYPGKIESDEERARLNGQLMQLQGSENSNSILVVETPPDLEGDLIENIAANNNDRLFELTYENVVQRIMNNYRMPFPIAGLQPANGGIFNQEQMEDSMTYYNAQTREERAMVARVFNAFLEFWSEGAIDVGEIDQLTFAETTDDTDLEDDDDDAAEGVTEEEEKTEEQNEEENDEGSNTNN